MIASQLISQPARKADKLSVDEELSETKLSDADAFFDDEPQPACSAGLPASTAS